MKKLLVLADDLTGALDTGVQFSKFGVKTQIIRYTEELCFENLDNVDVIVVDSETRHLSAEDAYHVIYTLCQKAKYAGIEYYYKKTDSALRGNIGSELSAVLDATKHSVIHFVPAYPASGRTTKNGIHYWKDVPIHETAFGSDLFNPITTSSIADIIHLQSSTPVQNLTCHTYSEQDIREGIVVWDSESDEDLKAISALFLDNPPYLMAGCAGFAAYLPALLQLPRESHCEVVNIDNMVILCGSIHPVTKKQVDFAKRNGITEIRLTPEQKLFSEYYKTEQGIDFVQSICKRVTEAKTVIIDTYDDIDQNTLKYAQKAGISNDEIRNRITESLACIGEYLIKHDICHAFFLTGGDTALGLMDRMKCYRLRPLCEIGEGTVLSKVECGDKTIHVLSKSGGLGEENILLKSMQLVYKTN